MSRLGNSRLLELADHLESDDRGHDKFYFGMFSDYCDFLKNPKPCGTAGCALGECPFLFKDDWKFNSSGHPVLKTSNADDPYSGAAKYFDITLYQTFHLFSPYDRSTVVYGEKKLKGDATRQEVAHNIREFVKLNSIPWSKLKINFKTVIRNWF